MSEIIRKKCTMQIVFATLLVLLSSSVFAETQLQLEGIPNTLIVDSWGWEMSNPDVKKNGEPEIGDVSYRRTTDSDSIMVIAAFLDTKNIPQATLTTTDANGVAVSVITFTDVLISSIKQGTDGVETVTFAMDSFNVSLMGSAITGSPQRSGYDLSAAAPL